MSPGRANVFLNRISDIPCSNFGISSLGLSMAQKTAVSRNGGDNVVGTSRLSDIAIAVAKVLDPAHFEETADRPIYMYSVAISERYLTRLRIQGLPRGYGRLDRRSRCRPEKGDVSKMFYYFFQMMYRKGYSGDTQHMSWNEWLGLKTMSEDDIKNLISKSAQGLGMTC